ncbi:membrane hypothetical protein [Desulfosarcina cetonica]|nr:membrane hypothetical protein [Desulfosarcina cetonica]
MHLTARAGGAWEVSPRLFTIKYLATQLKPWRQLMATLHNLMNKLIVQDLAICSGLMLSNWKLRRIARDGGAYKNRHYISLIIFIGFLYAFYLLFYSKTNELIHFREEIANGYFGIYGGFFILFIMNNIFRTEQPDLNQLYLRLIENQFVIFGILFLILTVSVLLKFIGT